MSKDPSRRSRDLTSRERREELQRFSPADAAFVAHLTGCERCRGHAARLLMGEEALGDGRPEADLPLVELQKFLDSLSPEQAGFVSHLLHCERCLQAAARTLKPRPVQSSHSLHQQPRS
jgi:hypothetical protein